MSNRIRADVQVGGMRRSDIGEALFEVDSQSYTSPVSASWFERHYERFGERVRFVVARENGVVIGYTAVGYFGSDVVIARFGVRADKRREGVGTAMIDWIKRKLGNRRRVRICAVIGERNGIGQLFLRSCGFSTVLSREAVMCQVVKVDDGFYLFEYFYEGKCYDKGN